MKNKHSFYDIEVSPNFSGGISDLTMNNFNTVTFLMSFFVTLKLHLCQVCALCWLAHFSTMYTILILFIYMPCSGF